MESPKTTAISYCDLSTPKQRKLYWAEKFEECSPKFCGVQERQEEVGWDDSPEPIKLDPKIVCSYSRKKLDSKRSPISSIPKAKRKLPRVPLKYSLTSNDLALMDDLSRRVLTGIEDKNLELLQDDMAETLIACTQHIENIAVETGSAVKSVSEVVKPNIEPLTDTLHAKPSRVNSMPRLSADCRIDYDASNDNRSPKKEVDTTLSNSCTSNLSSTTATNSSDTSKSNLLDFNKNKEKYDNCLTSEVPVCQNDLTAPSPQPNQNDSSLELALECFNDEKDDEWLSQVVIEVKKTPGKSKSVFAKSRSENYLSPPGRSPQFRRTASFNLENTSELINQRPLKKQKSFTDESQKNQTQCSIAEIERKRLEAKFRREFREIEKKKLEALRRLNERKAKIAAVKSNGTVNR